MATVNRTSPTASNPELASDLLNNYTLKQARDIFSTIASHADGLSFFLATLLDKTQGHSPEIASGIEMACRSAELIGMLADRPTGGTVKGSMEDWCCGPNFGPIPNAG